MTAVARNKLINLIEKSGKSAFLYLRGGGCNAQSCDTGDGGGAKHTSSPLADHGEHTQSPRRTLMISRMLPNVLSYQPPSCFSLHLELLQPH